MSDTAKKITSRLYIADNEIAMELYGSRESNLKRLESIFDVRLTARGNELIISGSESVVDRVQSVIESLLPSSNERNDLSSAQVTYTLDVLESDSSADVAAIFSDTISVPSRKRFIRPRTAGQRSYIQSIRENTIVFSIGPAGTGKTYLAMAMAIEALLREEVRRLVLARPAVEAGESLGFLPGDLSEKVSPYLRPLYDALNDMMDFDRAQRLIDRGVIEVVPLAFMRGRTLNEAFVILDEAQNTTFEQMKMFLTRLGYGSKAVVTGDITQIDLPVNATSGLVEIQYILNGVPGIGFSHLSRKDVVRHRIIQGIVEAYEKYEKEHNINEDSRRLKSKRGKT